MLRLWQDVDPDQNAVDLVLAGQLPTSGWRHVFDGYDDQDRQVSLIHEDTTVLRQMAVFDLVCNNADRKGGHVLAMPDGHRFGVDHGLTFHVERKLRTVLWGWLGEPLTELELAGIERVRSGLFSDLGDSLTGLLTQAEIVALAERCTVLLAHPEFPSPRGEMPAIPWPPF
ncbi:SCO1664 family protein [Aeromicrobium sp. UC242_57]|uniref:SCO1664 family protein n=1 Tax=Aeromicrobium sp. UC242_57 TaxID=3374624 RepID=UPI0037B77149